MNKELDLIEKDLEHYLNNVSEKKLKKVIEYLKENYYNGTNKRIVQDEIYDILENKYKTFIKNENIKIEKKKIKLPFYMSSLNQLKTIKEINNFISKNEYPFILSHKLDGASALIYKNKMYSKGNDKTNFGQDITHLIKPDLYEKIKILSENYAIRGELIITKKDFIEIKDKYNLTLARAASSGLINSKTIKPYIYEITNFIAYNIIYPSNLTMFEQYEILKKYDIPIVENIIINENLNIEILTKYLDESREYSKYEIDGIVIMSNKCDFSNLDNPECGFKFKTIMSDQILETTVINVNWDISMDGYLIPIIIIDPVEIAGTIISKTTGFNAKYIFDNNINIGTRVSIIKCGDVIPNIYKIIKSSNEPLMPKLKYKWNETKINILLDEENEEEENKIKSKLLVHFMKTLDIKNISIGIINKLMEYEINDVFDLLNIDKKELYFIEGLGKKSIDKIYDNLNEKLLNTKLEILMDASHIFERGLGEKKLKLIIEKYPNILLMKNDPDLYEKIINIHGFSEISTNQFIDNLPEFMRFFDKLNEYIDLSYLLHKNNNLHISNKFEDKIFVQTGFRDKEIENYIIENGGKLLNSISKKTNFLIYTDITSSKFLKAEELNIKTIHKDNFFTYFK